MCAGVFKMASTLTAEKRKEFAQVFVSLDKDGNGTLDIAEIANWLKESGYKLSKTETERLFKWMDKDGNGDVSLKEFLDAMAELDASSGGEDARKSVDAKQNKLLRLFKSMDTNGDGELSAEELFIGLDKEGIKVTRDKVEKLVRKLDKDGNGQISYLEFLAAFK